MGPVERRSRAALNSERGERGNGLRFAGSPPLGCIIRPCCVVRNVLPLQHDPIVSTQRAEEVL